MFVLGKGKAGQEEEMQKRKRRMKVDVKKLDRVKLYGQVKKVKGYWKQL